MTYLLNKKTKQIVYPNNFKLNKLNKPLYNYIHKKILEVCIFFINIKKIHDFCVINYIITIINYY